MKVQAIFVVDKKKNILIFLGLLDESIKINQKDLAEILGKITTQANDLDLNVYSKIQIGENFYLFGNFEKIIIAVQHLKDDPPPQFFLKELKNNFVKHYANILESYTIYDISKFKSFIDEIKRILVQFPVRNYDDLDKIGKEAIIKPIERESYPDGISQYKRDEILWNETKLVKDKYAANFIEGMIFNLEIFLTISSAHNYKLTLDFFNYPEKPIIIIDEKLDRDLGYDLEDLLYFFKNWNPNEPPHIIEIVDDLHAVIKKFYDLEKLTDMGVVAKSEIPDTKPLPKINSLKEEEED